MTEHEKDHDEPGSYQGILATLIRMRKELGLPPEWVAEKAGFSIAEYYLIEAGDRKVTYEESVRIDDAIYYYEESLKSPYQRLWEGLSSGIRYKTYWWWWSCRNFFRKNKIISEITEWILILSAAVLYLVFLRPYVVELLIWGSTFAIPGAIIIGLLIWIFEQLGSEE